MPKSQRQYSDGTSLVEENAMLKKILHEVCEALEAETKANNDNAETVKNLKSTLRKLERKLASQSRPVATSENSGVPSSQIR